MVFEALFELRPKARGSGGAFALSPAGDRRRRRGRQRSGVQQLSAISSPSRPTGWMNENFTGSAMARGNDKKATCETENVGPKGKGFRWGDLIACLQ
jgi:hypothetical protein